MGEVNNKKTIIYFSNVKSINIINSRENKMGISQINFITFKSTSTGKIILVNNLKLVHLLSRNIVKTELIQEDLTTFEFVFRIYWSISDHKNISSYL